MNRTIRNLFWFIIGFVLVFILIHICYASMSERIKAYYPILAEEHSKIWPESDVTIIAGQIEAESAWKEKATRLEKSGVTSYGLMQVLDVTFNEMKKKNPTLLDIEPVQMLQARWGIRAGILYDKQMFKLCTFASNCPVNQWAFALASYNGGYGYILKDRKLTESMGYDKNLWFDNVEKFSNRSPQFFKINRGYPIKIFKYAEKYRR